MATDPDTLSDVAKLRNLLANAEKQGISELAFRCRARIAEVRSQPYSEGIEREFWNAIFIAEEIASQKNGKPTRLSRTRDKVKRVGVLRTVMDLAENAKTSPGFRLLIDARRPDLTAEAIVLRNRSDFSDDQIRASEIKLANAGVSPIQLRNG